MKVTEGLRAARRAGLYWSALGLLIAAAILTTIVAPAQGVSTTTVQDTVHLANGHPGAGTVAIRWPAFTTAAGQAVAAGSLTVKISGDGFLSVSLAPNQGATPAGQFYTAVFYLSDGSTSTEYWVVPAAATATLAQIRAQVMPAAQAVQAVSKGYVDQSISQLTQSLLTAAGGSVSGPLYLNGDPTQALQAADKHYVDAQMATAVPLNGGAMAGPLTLSGDPSQDLQAADKHYVDATANAAATNAWPGMVLRADQLSGSDFGAKLQACVNAVSSSYGGTCDARNFSGNLSMSSNLTISNSNTTVLLPCATITTANQIVVGAGTRNVALRGCAMRGGSAASGSTGGTAFAYSGAGAMIQVGDTAYVTDTPGFHMDNAVINTTASASATAQGIAAYRTQELDLESLYLLGNANQTGMTLDGTGNYTGGTFMDNQISGFQTAVNAIGHRVANAAATDWVNASTFVRLHINCPTSGSDPIVGTVGINLQQGDGNTITGGDVEGCATALHLGPNAQNNTIVGLRNENSTKQVVADVGSSYNSWVTGGTMFTGQLTDNGTRNSFLDTFHRSFNALNGDWYGSQQDATLTNHYRLGVGAGNERGLQDRYQTDQGYRWTMGLSDATGGAQYYQILDELNNVYRFSIGQYNQGQGSTNNQTVINSAGTGAVVLNGSSGAGTGGVVIGSGGSNTNTVATVNNAGNAQFNGTLQVGGTTQSTGTLTVRNSADAEVDYYLWPGLTTSQKGSFTYKDWNGNSQWYLVKDANNNWALNSAVGGLDSFKAYQSTNSGDTYVNASNASGVVRVNYEPGAGTGFKIYGGNSSTLYASFTGTSSIAFPGLAAAGGHNCLQIDASGYITNTGVACGTGSGSGTVNAGNTGQVAYYTGNGTAVSGMNAVPVTAGGTGASSAAAALANLGALSSSGGALTGAVSGTDASFAGTVATTTAFSGPGTGLTGTAANLTAGAAVHAQNLPADFAAQSTAAPSTASFSTVSATAITGNGYQVGSGTMMTGNHGNGTSLQHSDNTGTSTLAAFDASGNMTAASSANVTSVLGYSPVNKAGDTITGSLTAADLISNGTPWVDARSYASLSAALTATPDGGTVFLPWGYAETITSPIDVGTNGHTRHILAIGKVKLTCDLNDSSKDCIRIRNGSSMECLTGPFTGSTNPTLNQGCMISQGSAVHDQVRLGDDPTVVGWSTFQMSGWQFENISGWTANSQVHIGPYINQPSVLRDTNILYPGSGQIGLLIEAGPETIERVESDGADLGIPCAVQPALTGYPTGGDNRIVDARWSSVTCEHPGKNLHAAVFDGTNGNAYGTPSSGINGFSCNHCHFEGDYAENAPDTTSLVFIKDVKAFSIHDGYLTEPGGGGSGYGFEIAESVAGRTDAILLDNASNTAYAKLVTNTINGDVVNQYQGTYTYGTSAAPTVHTDTQIFRQADADSFINVDAGLTVSKMAGIKFLEKGVPAWRVYKAATGGGEFYIEDIASGAAPNPRFYLAHNFTTVINAGGGQPVSINSSNNSSGGGLAVYSGAAASKMFWRADYLNGMRMFNAADGSTLLSQIDMNGKGTFNGGVQIGTGTAMTGNHGNGTLLQHSDGTGTSGYIPKWDPNGNLTDGKPIAGAGAGISTGPTSGTVAGHISTYSDTAGTEQDSGIALAAIPAANLAPGALASGMTATTQSAGDNSTKVATTAYVGAPGAIAPTTVTASGMITGANDSTRTTSTTMTNSWTTTGLVLPTVPVSTTKSGHCTIYWQMSSTSYTATFGLGMNSAPTNVWGGTRMIYAAAGTSNWLAFTQSSTSTTAISAATTAGAAGTTYAAQVDFAIQTGASNPVAVTIYGQTSNSGATLTVMPGSTCYWLP